MAAPSPSIVAKNHRAFGIASALICCAILFAGLPARAQQGKSESSTEKDDTYGVGGKVTTTYSDHDGKHFVEKNYFDPKGTLRKKRSEVSDGNGSVAETEAYQDGKIAFKIRLEKDASGKILRTQMEFYEDGVLTSGSRADYTGGDRTTTHRFNAATGTWEPVKPEEKKEKKTVGRLILDRAVQMELTGTGETIGHIADVTMKNASNESLSFYFPPAILESKSGKKQDYIAPLGQEVALRSGQTKTIPVNGTCLERDKPPEGKGVTGDLILNDGNPEFANIDSHFSPPMADALLRIGESTYDAVDKLQKEGAFKDFPYHDKQEQRNIAIQWSVWSNPRICEMTGGQPATKEDFQTVVYKQVKEGDLASPKTKEKIDKGDDAMWSGIELASAKAKDLEKPDEDAVLPPSVVNVADNTASPPPTTETKPQGSPPPEKPADQNKAGPDNDLPEESYDALDNAKGNYLKGLFKFENKLSVDLTALRDDLFNPKLWGSPDYKKKLATYNKLLVDVPKEFTKTKEGKKLFDQWLETYEKVYKTGKKVPKYLVPNTADPYLKPVAKDDEIANKKQVLDSAQLDLEKENAKYSQMQKDSVASSDAVKKFEAQIEKEYGKGNQADTGKLKQLQADMENAGKQVAKDWASTDEAKDQMKKVQQAEKNLDKAKEAYKPYEQLEEKPAKSTKP